MIYLIKILWGVGLIKKQVKNKDTLSISIKPETSIKDISKVLNKLIVFINSWLIVLFFNLHLMWN